MILNVPKQILITASIQARGGKPMKIKKPSSGMTQFLTDHAVDFTKSGGWETHEVPSTVLDGYRHWLDGALPKTFFVVVPAIT